MGTPAHFLLRALELVGDRASSQSLGAAKAEGPASAGTPRGYGCLAAARTEARPEDDPCAVLLGRVGRGEASPHAQAATLSVAAIYIYISIDVCVCVSVYIHIRICGLELGSD